MATMREFRDPKAGHRVMYSTTGVGGVGLDMSVANRVIVVDASWNPAVDLQAIARAWRMGQKKQTFVYRLIAHGTLEERILRMQVQKTSLAMRVMEENEITRFYSKENLKSLDERLDETMELTLSPEAVRTVDAALANVMTADNDLVVSSHDHMFLDDEVELSEEEKARAMNEMVLALYDGFTLRTVSIQLASPMERVLELLYGLRESDILHGRALDQLEVRSYTRRPTHVHMLHAAWVLSQCPSKHVHVHMHMQHGCRANAIRMCLRHCVMLHEHVLWWVHVRLGAMGPCNRAPATFVHRYVFLLIMGLMRLCLEKINLIILVYLIQLNF